MAFSLGLGCSDDDKYSDPEAWWDPYHCCDQFFTSTSAFEVHKLMFHGQKKTDRARGVGADADGGKDDGKDGGRGGGKGGGNAKGARNVLPLPSPSYGVTDFGDDSSDDYDDYDDHDHYFGGGPFDHICYLAENYPVSDSEDEAMKSYVYQTSLCAKQSKKKSKRKSKSKGAESSFFEAAADDDFFPLGCSLCGLGHFQDKGTFLLHMAMCHRTCGVCFSASQDAKTAFGKDDHYTWAPGCVRNTKRKPAAATSVEKNAVSRSDPAAAAAAVETKVVTRPAPGNDTKAVTLFGSEIIHSDEESGGSRFLCLACGDNQGSGKELRQHYASVHLKCLTCKLQFDTEDDLLCHFEGSKVHFRKYCDTCGLEFSSKEGLTVHNAVCHLRGSNHLSGAMWWPCDACTKAPKAFVSEEELETHIQFQHVRCFPCKREFTQAKSLCNHLVASSQHNFCIRCDSDFVSSTAFRLHHCSGKKVQEPAQPQIVSAPATPIQNLSLNDTKQADKTLSKKEGSLRDKYDGDLSCCVCEEGFDSLEERKWHEYDSHIWCTKCNKQLASRMAFNEHQLSAEGHNMCFECGDHFETPESLAQHRLVTKSGFPLANIPSDYHVKTRKYVCDTCDYKVVFKTEQELAAHLSLKH